MATATEDAKKVRKFLAFRKTKSESQVKAPETAQSTSGATTAKGNASVSSSRSTLVRKSKSLKRIRGFLNGESRRERRARKAAAAATATTSSSTTTSAGVSGKADKVSSPPTEDDDDEESVYQVDVDDRSLAASSYTPPLTPERSLLGNSKEEESDDHDDDPVHSNNSNNNATIPAAIVPVEEAAGPALQVVLLLMDPVTRRFELLQLEFDSHKAVVNDVLAQAPHSVTEAALRKQTYVGICDRLGTELTNTVRLAEFCKANEVVVAIPQGISGVDCARLARPILSDNKVISMLKSSGIDVSGWKIDKEESGKKSKKSKKSSSKTSKPVVAPVEAAEPTVAAPLAASPVAAITPEPPTVEKKKSSFRGLFLTVVFVGLLAFGLQVVHTYISSPIPVGQVVSPGVWLSRCGLLAFQQECKNSFLHMGRDGVVTLYGPEQELAWQMIGVTCPADDTGCVDGLEMRENGIVTIGGKIVTTVTVYGNQSPPLSPWPFAVPPKVRMVRARK